MLVLAGAGWVVWPQGLCVLEYNTCTVVSKNFPQAKWASVNIFPGYEWDILVLSFFQGLGDRYVSAVQGSLHRLGAHARGRGSREACARPLSRPLLWHGPQRDGRMVAGACHAICQGGLGGGRVAVRVRGIARAAGKGKQITPNAPVVRCVQPPVGRAWHWE